MVYVTVVYIQTGYLDLDLFKRKIWGSSTQDTEAVYIEGLEKTH